MGCGHCRREDPPGARFCDACGHALARRLHAKPRYGRIFETALGFSVGATERERRKIYEGA